MSQANCVKTASREPAFLGQDDLKMLLFGGKGGVGKTTCAAAAALHLAGTFPQRRFLAVSTDPAHSLKDAFSGFSPPPNLELLEIDSKECFEKFKQAHAQQFREIALRGTFLDGDDVDRFLQLSIPGLDELMAFNEISNLVEAGTYSCVIVDTAPTGHTLRLLELPEVLRTVVDALDAMLAKHRYMTRLYRGFYRKDETDSFLEGLAGTVNSLASLLSDRNRCLFVPVMLAEALSTFETRRLVHKLDELKIPVADILVNHLHPGGLDCPACLDLRARQFSELHNVFEAFPGHVLWGIPQQGAEVQGQNKLTEFWEGMRPINPGGAEIVSRKSLPPRVDDPAPIPQPDVSLLIYAGKGGTGKTTLASATACRLAAAYPGKRVLLFSADPAHSVSDCLGLHIGPIEVQLGPGLTAMEIDADAEFETLKEKYADEVERFFGSLTGPAADAAFDRETIKRIIDLSPPGLDEVMALIRAVEFLESERYHILVLDAAPTGHLIRWLELPGLVEEWLKAFFGLFLKYKSVFRLPRFSELMVDMSKKVKFLRSVLTDPKKGQLYVVGIPTEMALEETRDLLAACRRPSTGSGRPTRLSSSQAELVEGRTGIQVAGLFLNLLTPESSCPLCRELVEAESRMRDRFADALDGVPLSAVYRCSDPRGMDRLAELGNALYRN